MTEMKRDSRSKTDRVCFVVWGVSGCYYLLAVEVDGVVVVARVHDQTGPFAPAGRNVTAVVLVEIFAKISRTISSAGQVGAKRSGFVFSLPVSFFFKKGTLIRLTSKFDKRGRMIDKRPK